MFLSVFFFFPDTNFTPDLKPHNILLKSMSEVEQVETNVKIADFGFSMNLPEEQSFVQASIIMGTDGFIGDCLSLSLSSCLPGFLFKLALVLLSIRMCMI